MKLQKYFSFHCWHRDAQLNKFCEGIPARMYGDMVWNLVVEV